MSMTIRLLKDILGGEYLMTGKFVVLQVVLILAKLQGLVTRSLVWTDILPCRPPITPAVYGNRKFIRYFIFFYESFISNS